MADNNLPSYDEVMKNSATSTNLPSYDEVMKGSTSPKADDLENKISSGLDYINPLEKVKSAVSHIPVVGQDLSDSLQDTATGFQEGATGGLRDEILGGIKGAGKTALQGITGEIPQNKSAIEQLVDNYYKYKGVEEQKQKDAHNRSAILAGGSKIAGSFLPAGKAFQTVSKAPLIAKMLTGAGLGAAQGFGESEATLKDKPEDLGFDTIIGAGLGAASVPVGEVLANKTAQGINYIGNKVANSEIGKQMAATLLNASKGGTVFGQKGALAIKDLDDQMVNHVTDQITKNGQEANQLYTDAFNKATQAGKTLETPSSTKGMSTLADFFDGVNANKVRLAPEEQQVLKDYEMGTLDPQRAFSFIRKLKEMKSENFNNVPFKNTISNFIEDLTNGTNKILDGKTLQNLNTKRSTAFSMMEPFIQKANQVVPDPAYQNINASDLTIEQSRQRIRSLIKSLSDKAGSPSNVGTEAQAQLAKLQQVLKDTNSSVNFNINPNEMAKGIQDQSYLNNALLSRQGIRQNTSMNVHNANPFVAMKDYGALFAAEKMSGNKTAQTISERILSKDPIQMQESARALYSNPKTKHLADQLISASEVNNNQKLTNTAFQIMQNPEAKKALGATSDNEDEDKQYVK